MLLLDEPTAALDPGQRRRLWERVAALRERGGAVVFATQNLEEVELVAGRVAALREGRLVFDGTTGEYDRAPRRESLGVNRVALLLRRTCSCCGARRSCSGS